MANHVIYDRIWESRKLAACSLKAALAYPWIYLVADDWGRFEYLPRRIWGMVFGARADVKLSDVVAWLDEYARAGLLVRYDGNPPGSTGGAPIPLCAWAGYVGPPLSKRKAPTLPRPDGTIETEGFRVDSRFRTSSHEEATRKTRGNQVAAPKQEAGSRKQEVEAVVPPEQAVAQEDPPGFNRIAVTLEGWKLMEEISKAKGEEPQVTLRRNSTVPRSGYYMLRFDTGKPEHMVRTLNNLRDEAAAIRLATRHSGPVALRTLTAEEAYERARRAREDRDGRGRGPEPSGAPDAPGSDPSGQGAAGRGARGPGEGEGADDPGPTEATAPAERAGVQRSDSGTAGAGETPRAGGLTRVGNAR